MSFQDIEAGRISPQTNNGAFGNNRNGGSGAAQSAEDAAFMKLQSSLALQVFKINANVQGIVKLVDQLGTPRDSAHLRKSLCVRVILRLLGHVFSENCL
jgi:hypothetical protein